MESTDILNEDVTGQAASSSAEASESASSQDSSAITLDPSVLHEKDDTYSSLTDENAISLFTDEYENNVEMVRENKLSEEQKLQESLFTADIHIQESADQELKDSLFLSSTQPLKKQDYVPPIDYSFLGYAGIALAFMIGVVIAVSFFDRKKRKVHKNAVDHYTY